MWVEGCQLRELRAIARGFKIATIDSLDANKWIEFLPAFAIWWLPYQSGDRITLTQAMLAHERQRDIDVIWPWHIATSTHECVVIHHIENAGYRSQDVIG